MSDNKRKAAGKTLSDVCDEWLSMERLLVKQSTYSKYYDAVHKHITPQLGGIRLGELTSAQINCFIYEKLRHGRLDNAGPLSAKTVRDIYTLLKSVLKYAENEYDLDAIAKNTALPKRELKKYEIFTMEEQTFLEKNLRGDPFHPRKMGILLCLYSGLRIGEICALRWEDIDFEEQLVHVRHTIQRIPITDPHTPEKTCVVLDTPKSAASLRTIPLNASLITLLKTLRSNTLPDRFLLTNRSDYVEPRNYQYFFHTYLKKAGMRNVNFHILRHTFASRCVEAGFDVKTLSEILGHSNTEITLSYYIHTTLENKRRQMDLLHFPDILSC